MSHKPPWFRLTLLGVTIVGGLHGIVITVGAFFRPDVPGFGVTVLLVCMVGAYAYVSAAGVVFWRHPDQSRPLFWALMIQVPWISLPGFVYKFAAGLSRSVALVANHTGDKYSAGFGTNWNLGSSSEFRLLQDAPVELGVNVAAVLALLLLRSLTRSTPEALGEPPSKGDEQGATSISMNT